MKKFNYSPLVGILTSKGKLEDSFRGDHSVFKSIQKELMKVGGLSFIFTTEGVHRDYVSGYIYLHHDQKWGKLSFPFPDLIYNKVSSRIEETHAPFLALKQLYKKEGKYFFNPCFFNKWESYCSLSKSKQLSAYLPKTWIYTNMNDLLSKLSTYHALYVKPVTGHKGKGIYKLSFDGLHFYLHRKNKRIKYFHSDFVQDIETLLKNKQYLIQTEIHTDKIDKCKYDLRILCLFDNGIHKIFGVGVRKAAAHSIITHVPNGGDIISFQRIEHKCSISQLNWLAQTVGAQLTESYGFIGEFSMDVGLTPQGDPMLFEVNSKPMIFDEMTIQKNRITQLVELFTKLTNVTTFVQEDF
ncbi:YheC/YheD family protein [Metabacillus sp. FJAT-53654]|uniref:YheC/YheD family protein n=1 Tax=Metabacillus rhizosphaerae TaxID=3117747 RepID=A0ABZ2MTV9_9BACI